jgi:hypothetical protein
LRQKEASDIDLDQEADMALKQLAKHKRTVDHISHKKEDTILLQQDDTNFDHHSQMRGDNILAKALDEVSVD